MRVGGACCGLGISGKSARWPGHGADDAAPHGWFGMAKASWSGPAGQGRAVGGANRSEGSSQWRSIANGDFSAMFSFLVPKEYQKNLPALPRMMVVPDDERTVLGLMERS